MASESHRTTTVSRLLRLVLVAAACSTTVLTAAAQGAATAPATEYRIGPRDVLAVAVFNQPTLSGKFTVEGDGTFTFPLLGRIEVGGLTARRVEDSIRERLRDGILTRPEVSVSIEQYGSKHIYIVGEIRQPGEYTLTEETTLIGAVARAGSATTDASGEIVVLRPSSSTPATRPVLPDQVSGSELLRVSLEKLQAGQVSQNVTLQDGDTVFLPRAEKVYVYGEVRAPGAYAVQKDITVLQALSLAGGVTEHGATNRIRIARFIDGTRQEVRAKLGDRVKPGDTIIVPERYF